LTQVYALLNLRDIFLNKILYLGCFNTQNTPTNCGLGSPSWWAPNSTALLTQWKQRVNDVPDDVTPAPSLSTLRRHLKTYFVYDFIINNSGP